MLTYVSRFWSGGFEPFWSHVALLSLDRTRQLCGCVPASYLNAPKYPAAVHRVAFWLVVAGVAIEAVCTIFLFVFDEGISTAQQSRIGALDAEVSDTRNTAKTALASAQHNVDVANDLLEENLRLRAKIAAGKSAPMTRVNQGAPTGRKCSTK